MNQHNNRLATGGTYILIRQCCGLMSWSFSKENGKLKWEINFIIRNNNNTWTILEIKNCSVRITYTDEINKISSSSPFIWKTFLGYFENVQDLCPIWNLSTIHIFLNIVRSSNSMSFVTHAPKVFLPLHFTPVTIVYLMTHQHHLGYLASRDGNPVGRYNIP